MIVLDANILVSATRGTWVRRVFADAVERRLRLVAPDRAVHEAFMVLSRAMKLGDELAEEGLAPLLAPVLVLPASVYAGEETAARARLEPHAQHDWPILAAALAVDGAIWSHDRDFFGGGVPVWTARTLGFA